MARDMPQRIVSLVPSTTESVCAFGRGSDLVGCTRYCEQPVAELAGVRRVGGTKNPAREVVLALAPDLVLANAEENRAEDIEWLGARVPVLVQTPRTVAEAAACLLELADRIGVPAAAQPFVQRIDQQVAAAATANRHRPPVAVYYPIWRRPWMTINGDTFVHDVLRCAGMRNVAAGAAPRYPVVSVEAVQAWRPDAVLLPSEPWCFTPEDRDECARQRMFATSVVELCDGRDFCWHGVRLADGLARASRLADSLAHTIAASRR
jgi:ABC-type Fe3+-hydroxamate transport system substrate-binding protein